MRSSVRCTPRYSYFTVSSPGPGGYWFKRWKSIGTSTGWADHWNSSSFTVRDSQWPTMILMKILIWPITSLSKHMIAQDVSDLWVWWKCQWDDMGPSQWACLTKNTQEAADANSGIFWTRNRVKMVCQVEATFGHWQTVTVELQVYMPA